MSCQAYYVNDGLLVKYTAVAALLNHQVVQIPDGRAGVIQAAVAIGELASARVDGIIEVTKPTTYAFLAGGDCYWDQSAGVANFKLDSGTDDFYLGMVVEDAAAAATTVRVALNRRARYSIDYQGGQDEWTTVNTNASTALVVPGGATKLAVIATNEAEAASMISNNGVLVSAKPILEGRFKRIAASGSASDIDVGLASAASTSDFEAVTTFAAFHLDGGDNNISTHSDDNTTDRAPADSTIDDVDDTYGEYWIDARDPTNVKFYVNGVLVDTSATKRVLAVGTAVLKAIAMIEKTTGTETGSMAVSRLRVRTTAE